MAIHVQNERKESTKEYAAVAQAIVLVRRPDGVWRAELIKLTGMDLSRWGTRMCHHPDWKKGYRLIATQHMNREWHFHIVPI